ncbi:ABC transporter permease subunit, partial [Bacillus subtilis]|nr:ABC transporter permease subunit [Bacillus subtilis]
MALLMKKVANSAGTEDNILNFLSFSSGMLILVQFFALAVGGSMVAKEFEAGTIKLLLIRPARRSTILASKYLTLILISLYYLLSYLLF